MDDKYSRLQKLATLCAKLTETKRLDQPASHLPELEIFRNLIKKEELDFLFKLITILLNSSDHAIFPAAKFTLVYFMKTIASHDKLKKIFIESLSSQEFLVRTLIKIALYKKNVPFPYKGEGFFASWQGNRKEVTEIANKLIGLILENFKYFASNSADIFFKVIVNGLSEQFKYKYPDFGAYCDNKGSYSLIHFTYDKLDPGTAQNLHLLYFSCEDKNESTGTDLAINLINKLEIDMKNTLIKYPREDSLSFEEDMKGLLDQIIEYQMHGIKIKMLLNDAPLLEINGENMELLLRANYLIKEIDRIAHITMESLTKKDRQECLQNFKNIELKEDKNVPLKERIQNNFLDENKIVSEKEINKDIYASKFEQKFTHKAHAEDCDEKAYEEETKMDLKQTRIPSFSEYEVIEPYSIVTEKLPKILLKNYGQWTQTRGHQEYKIYEGCRRDNYQIKILLKIYNTKQPNLEFNHEIRYRKTIKHPRAAPLEVFGKPPEDEFFWFAEIEKKNIHSRDFNSIKFDLTWFLREMVDFLVDLRDNYGLIFENLTAEDIVVKGLEKTLLIRNWFKAHEYLDEKQEMKALKSLGECIMNLFGLDKKIITETDSLKILQESNSLKRVFGRDADDRNLKTNLEMLDKFLEAETRKNNFAIVIEKIKGGQDIDNTQIAENKTLNSRFNLLIFDQKNQNALIIGESGSCQKSFKDENKLSKDEEGIKIFLFYQLK